MDLTCLNSAWSYQSVLGKSRGRAGRNALRYDGHPSVAPTFLSAGNGDFPVACSMFR